MNKQDGIPVFDTMPVHYIPWWITTGGTDDGLTYIGGGSSN